MSMVSTICFGFLGIAALAAMLRLILGPTTPDRVVALDLISVIAVAIIVVYDITIFRGSMLDAAIVVALVGFAGTVAISTYIDRRGPS